MLPNAVDLIASCGRWAHGCRLSQLLRSAAPEGEHSLNVLARGDYQGFYVYLLEPPEPKPSHPVPIFGLGKQRLDPHLPLS
jgi:hypothetical protein